MNREFKYPKYFSVIPTGPNTKASFTEGFFQVALAQNPKPTTVALVAEDAEFSNNACEGARENAKKFDLQDRLRQEVSAEHDGLHADRARDPGGQPRLVIICSYPLELGRHGQRDQRTQLQAEDDRRRDGRPAGHRVQEPARRPAQRHRQLRDLGAVREDDGAGPTRSSRSIRRAPAPKASIRSATISAAGAMPNLSVLGQAIKGAKSIEDDKVADYLRKTRVQDHHGRLEYGPDGEWTKSGMMQVQYHDIKEGETWKGMNYQTVLTPAEIKTGNADLSLREGEVSGLRPAARAFSSANMTPRGPTPRGVSHSRTERGCHASHRPVPCRDQDQRSRCDGEVLHRGARHEARAPSGLRLSRRLDRGGRQRADHPHLRRRAGARRRRQDAVWHLARSITSA